MQNRTTITNTQQNFFKRLSNFVYRSQFELAISFVLASIILCTQYGARAIQKLDTSNGSDPILAQTTSELVSTKLSALSSLPFANTAVLVLFWTGAAVLLYISFLIISNAVITLKNEISLESHSNKRHAFTLVRHIVLKIVVLILFYALVAGSLRYLIPYWINLSGLYINAGMAINTLHYFGLGLIALAWNIYLIWILGKLVFSYEKSL